MALEMPIHWSLDRGEGSGGRETFTGASSAYKKEK